MTEYTGDELELFKNATNWKKYFTSYLRKYIKGAVLEVGAGIGFNTKYLVTNEVTSWTFIEPDSTLSNKISDYNTGISIPKKIIVGTIDNLTNEKFDTIIYIDVLEHIKESKEEIRKINKMLNTGGHLIILVPAFQFLYNEFDHKLGHYRRYNRSLLKTEVTCLLEEKKIFYLDSCGLMASFFNKTILKRKEITLFQVLFWDKILIPISKITDQLLNKKAGKSLIGIFEKKTDS